VRTRTKHPTDIAVGANPKGVAVTPDGKTAYVTNADPGSALAPSGDSVSTIDVKTRTKHPTDIPVGPLPLRVDITADGKTAFVTNNGSDSVSTIEVKTRTKHAADIPVGTDPTGVAVTPDGKTAFVTNQNSGTVSTIDVKTRTKHPTDIAVGEQPSPVAVTPCRR
jgi:YVTN family beta-propeller protein